MKTIKLVSVLLLVTSIGNSLWAQSTEQSNKSLYKAFEMSVSEGLNLQAEAKVGIKPVYGVFGIGNQFVGEDYHWAIGLGIGTNLLKQEKQTVNLEYMFYHVNQNELWTNNGNNLQQIKLFYSRRLKNTISVFGGPAFNINVAENTDGNGLAFKSTFPPYEMFTNVGANHTTTGWIGFTLGIRFDK